MAVLPTTKFLTNLPPSSVDLADHVVDQRVGQAELGNAVAQHAAEVVEGLEDGDREAFHRQQVGVDQAGGPEPTTAIGGFSAFCHGLT